MALPAGQRNSLGILKTRTEAQQPRSGAIGRERPECPWLGPAEGWGVGGRWRSTCWEGSPVWPSTGQPPREHPPWCHLTGLVLRSTGGLTAVIYTDALQTVIMVGGALVLMFLGKVEAQVHPTTK